MGETEVQNAFQGLGLIPVAMYYSSVYHRSAHSTLAIVFGLHHSSVQGLQKKTPSYGK